MSEQQKIKRPQVLPWYKNADGRLFRGNAHLAAQAAKMGLKPAEAPEKPAAKAAPKPAPSKPAEPKQPENKGQ